MDDTPVVKADFTLMFNPFDFEYMPVFVRIYLGQGTEEYSTVDEEFECLEDFAFFVRAKILFEGFLARG